MVSSLLHDAVYFQSVLEAIYTGLEGLDTSSYSWDPSDRWRQSRTADQWGGHLEAWADLGFALTMDRSSYTHDCRLMFSCRYQADTDSIGQARIHAAIFDACEFLMGLILPGGGRVVAVTGITLAGPHNGDFVVPTIQFRIRLPR